MRIHILSQTLRYVHCETTTFRFRLNRRLYGSCEKRVGGGFLIPFEFSPCIELNHSNGSKRCISHSVMLTLAPSEKTICHSLGSELVLRAVYSLLYRVTVSCYTNQYLHSCISKWGNRTKSIPAEEALCCDRSAARHYCELQLALCGSRSFLNRFYNLPVTSHKSVPFLNSNDPFGRLELAS